MSDIYEKEKIRIKDYRDVFRTEPGQTGAVFAIGREIFAMDVFDSADTCRKLMPKIIGSFAIEALDNVSDRQAGLEDVKAFLDVVSASDLSLKRSPGSGVTVSIKSPAASGTTLVSGDTVVHTAVFNTHEG